MRSTFLLAAVMLVGVVALCGAQTAAPGETPWFDMQNCAFCKHLSKDPELLKNMTWEHKDISNGVVSISTVKPEFKKSYDEAHMAMAELGKKLQSGEVKAADLKLCGHCQFYGKLQMMGAKSEFVDGDAADVFIMTSDKPEVVTEIKTFAQRNRDEMAKMGEAEKVGKTH